MVPIATDVPYTTSAATPFVLMHSLVRRDDLEERLLQRLSEVVLREDVIDYAIAGLKDEMEKRFDSLSMELERTRQRKRGIEEELGRLVRAIAEGQPSKSLMSAIADARGRTPVHHGSVARTGS